MKAIAQDIELSARLTMKPRLRRAEASSYLADRHGLMFAAATLATMATRGGGPPYNLAGRVPLYPVTELDAWAREKLGALVSNSAQARAARSTADADHAAAM